MKYGEKEIQKFDIKNKENFWPNEHKKIILLKSSYQNLCANVHEVVTQILQI